MKLSYIRIILLVLYIAARGSNFRNPSVARTAYTRTYSRTHYMYTKRSVLRGYATKLNTHTMHTLIKVNLISGIDQADNG